METKRDKLEWIEEQLEFFIEDSITNIYELKKVRKLVRKLLGFEVEDTTSTKNKSYLHEQVENKKETIKLLKEKYKILFQIKEYDRAKKILLKIRELE